MLNFINKPEQKSDLNPLKYKISVKISWCRQWLSW